LRIDKSGRTSAGILLWRTRDGRLEVLLAHPGGPLWVNKDLGHWTIPKGETETAADELLAVACREFAAASTRDRHRPHISPDRRHLRHGRDSRRREPVGAPPR